MRVVNVTIEDKDAARKEATELTWPEILELGLIQAEKGASENKIKRNTEKATA